MQELENIGAITLFVADVERAKQWYRRVDRAWGQQGVDREGRRAYR